MILSDVDIRKELEAGRIKIDPEPDLDKVLGTISLDLKLGTQFMTYRTTSRPYIDVRNIESFNELTDLVSKDENEPFILHPGEFVLGTTHEMIELPTDLAGRLEGRSSLGRLGIVIHSTAGKVDPGFQGRLVLEISNIGTLPVILYPGMRICQLIFEKLSSPTSQGYAERTGSKYKNQQQPLGSQITTENESPDKAD